MKYTSLKIIFIFVILFSCNNDDNTLPIPEFDCNYRLGDIYLDSQTKVDSFGEIGYCKIIDSHLIIGKEDGVSDITSLESLLSLTEINGDVRILNNPFLNNLNGLHNLKNANTVVISNNYSLMNLQGLDLLFTNENDDYTELILSNNSALQDLNGLGTIKELTRLKIENCSGFNSFSGLELCEKIGSLSIINNSSVINFMGLNSIKEINFFEVKDNLNLINFQGLSNLMTVSVLNLEKLFSLENLNLSNLFVDVKFIVLKECSLLSSLSGLENVHNLEKLSIEKCENLTTLNGFPTNLVELKDLKLKNNTNLVDISSLINITKLESDSQLPNGFTGGLDISYNAGLSNLNGLENISIFSGNLYIHSNPNLNNLCSLLTIKQNANLQYLLVGNNLNPVTYFDLNVSNCFN